MEEKAHPGLGRHLVKNELQALRVVGDLVHAVTRGHGEVGMAARAAMPFQASDDLLRYALDHLPTRFGLPSDELADGGRGGTAAEEAPALDEEDASTGPSRGDCGDGAGHPAAADKHVNRGI
jgi:hypothetical protein